jgi:predicted aconitase
MQPVAQPREFMATRQPSVVWVSKASEPNMFALDAPKLIGDSIVGFIEGEYTEIPIPQIRTMQARQYSRGRTVAFALGTAVAAVGAFLLIQGGHGATPDQTDEDDIGIIRFGR